MQIADVQRMVRSRAGSDPDRQGEAYLAYAKVLKEYDPSKGTRLSTLFYSAMENTLINHWKKESRRREADLIEDLIPGKELSPEYHARFRQFLSRLSSDATAVLRLLYGGSESKAALRRKLKAKGWTGKRIEMTFLEIQESMEAAL